MILRLQKQFICIFIWIFNIWQYLFYKHRGLLRLQSKATQNCVHISTFCLNSHKIIATSQNHNYQDDKRSLHLTKVGKLVNGAKTEHL